jgi:hypothetical protein
MCRLPRKSFLHVLQQRVKATPPGAIQLLSNASCTAITRNASGTIQVTSQH